MKFKQKKKKLKIRQKELEIKKEQMQVCHAFATIWLSAFK